MKFSRRKFIGALGAVALASGATAWWLARETPGYLHGDTTAFVALFTPPPARGSPRERQELDALLALQRARTPSQVAAARADRKTEISRFASALGMDEPEMARLPHLRHLASAVKDAVRPYVRAAKDHFRRLRPQEVEPAMQPCIGNVKEDLSYPSGHASYGYVMAYLLSDMVPERRAQLQARAEEFARQRMVCGVHFPSDIEAGRIGAVWLVHQLGGNPQFRLDRRAAAQELRAALHLPELPTARGD
jgi:acid phosphatase (class A)